MKVRDLCQPNVVTVQPGTPVAEAARLMIALRVGSVVVLEHGRVCGILTDRDIVARGVQHGHDLRGMTVADVMTLNPVVIEPDADLPRATVLMADKAVRRLPVVEEDGRLIGFLALDDVIVLVGDEMANVRAAVTAAISR
jgi:CBS domain-containing protein